MIHNGLEELSLIGEAIVKRFIDISEKNDGLAETAEDLFDVAARSCDHDAKESRIAILNRNFGADMKYLLGFSDGYRQVKANTLEVALVSTASEQLIGFRDGVSAYRILSNRFLEKKSHNVNP